jgi:hypothetical protein
MKSVNGILPDSTVQAAGALGVADLSLDKEALKTVIRKTGWGPVSAP